jgi:hypothetical protein
MPHFPHLRRKIRAPRVNLWGTASATIQLENGRHLWAKTLRISITGGLLELPTYLDEGVSVNLTVRMESRLVRGKATMLFPMWATQGYLQPFRFTDLHEQECRVLETEIQKLLKQTSASAPQRGRLGLSRPRFLEST